MSNMFGYRRPYAWVYMSHIRTQADVALVESLIGGVEYASRRDLGPVVMLPEAFAFIFSTSWNEKTAKKRLLEVLGPWAADSHIFVGVIPDVHVPPVFVIGGADDHVPRGSNRVTIQKEL